MPLVVQMTDDEKFLWKAEYDEKKGEYDLNTFPLKQTKAKDIMPAASARWTRPSSSAIATTWATCTRTLCEHLEARSRIVRAVLLRFQASSACGPERCFSAIHVPLFVPVVAFPIPLSKCGPQRRDACCLIPCAIVVKGPAGRSRSRACGAQDRAQVAPAPVTSGAVHSKFFPPNPGGGDQPVSREYFRASREPPRHRRCGAGITSSRRRWRGKRHRATCSWSRCRVCGAQISRGGRARWATRRPRTRTAVFLTDSDDEIRRKIMTHAFSGGRETV